MENGEGTVDASRICTDADRRGEQVGGGPVMQREDKKFHPVQQRKREADIRDYREGSGDRCCDPETGAEYGT